MHCSQCLQGFAVYAVTLDPPGFTWRISKGLASSGLWTQQLVARVVRQQTSGVANVCRIGSVGTRRSGYRETASDSWWNESVCGARGLLAADRLRRLNVQVRIAVGSYRPSKPDGVRLLGECL